MACFIVAASLVDWALCLVSSSGCRGCLRDDTEQLSREELEKKAREQKEALEAKPLRTLPADSDISITTAKAGHWVETVQQFKSNREDLQVVASGDVLRGPDKVMNIPHTSITAEFSRPTVLPKVKPKASTCNTLCPRLVWPWILTIQHPRSCDCGVVCCRDLC